MEAAQDAAQITGIQCELLTDGGRRSLVLVVELVQHPDFPPGNEPILNVWIVAGEVASHLRRVSAEEKSGSVDRIPQCAGQDYLAAIAGLPGEAQVLISKLSSALDIVWNDIVDQEIMHRSPGC